jgi:hypothetical protein
MQMAPVNHDLAARMTARISLTLSTFLLFAGLGISQEKAESDKCKEFLKNSVAIVALQRPFIVREAKGSCWFLIATTLFPMCSLNFEMVGKIHSHND